MDTFLELHLDKRIQEAKSRAERIMLNKHNSLEDGVFYLRSILSNHYRLPIFHEYFEKRTIDELIFEIELINAYNKPISDRGQDMLKENKEDASSLFDDMFDDDMVEVSNNNIMQDSEFEELSKQFMQSGEFK